MTDDLTDLNTYTDQTHRSNWQDTTADIIRKARENFAAGQRPSAKFYALQAFADLGVEGDRTLSAADLLAELDRVLAARR